MATKIPCPNPICTHEFTAAELQAATSLQCPKCGFRMQGRAPAPPAPAASKPAPAKPTAQPKPPLAQPIATPKPVVAIPIPPSAKPGSPPPPLATPIAAGEPPAAPSAAQADEDSIPDGAFFNPDIAPDVGSLVHSRKKAKKPFNWARLAFYLSIIGFAACVVIVAIVGVIWLAVGTDGLGAINKNDPTHTGFIRGPNNVSEKVYRLTLPKDDWSVDNEVLSNFGAHMAWKHNQYDFWFAIVVKDFVTTKPRDAEMLGICIDKLEGHFADAIELNKMAEPARIGDLAAQKLRFKGQMKASAWHGECYMFFNNGVAYWLFVASPHWEIVEHFAIELPMKNLKVLSDRRGWRDQPAPSETFVSDGGTITMTAPKEVWAKHPAKNEDEKGELFLFGRYLKGEKDNRKNASMLIYTIDKKDDLKDAVKAARAYLDDKTKAMNSNNKIVHAGEVVEGQTELGTIQNIGNRRGRVLDLKLQFIDDPKRYYLLAVVNDPDIGYAILCDSTWESRQIWRQEFIDLLGTFRVTKKGE